jgi:hypothetical protein
MGKEGFRPQNEQKRPSDALNEVFTPLMVAFRNKVEKTEWLDQSETYDLIARNLLQTILKPVDKMPNLRNQMFPFHEFPEIFVYAESQVEFVRTKPAFGTSAPVGEFGEAWSKRLVSCAKTLLDEISERTGIGMSNEAEKVTEQNKLILDEYTPLKTSFRGEKSGARMTSQLGLQLVLYTAGFLTQYKVPGYEDYGAEESGVDIAAKLFAKTVALQRR